MKDATYFSNTPANHWKNSSFMGIRDIIGQVSLIPKYPPSIKDRENNFLTYGQEENAMIIQNLPKEPNFLGSGFLFFTH